VCGCLSLLHLQYGDGIAEVGQNRQTAETRDDPAQEFESLAGKIARLERQAGDVAARSCQTGDKAVANRIVRWCEHDSG
jgi:hypothetical protein